MPFVPQGTFTALVTPFQSSGASPESAPIDWAAYEALIEAQIAGGVEGLVPCGTTGESPTLSTDEQRDVIARTVAVAKGRVPVIAGAGSSSTASSIALARQAEKAGADAIMIVVPYYNKPTQEGLYAHFVAIAQAVGLPLVVYNIPARTGIDMGAETILRVADTAKNVVAVKEATGNVLRAQELVRLAGDRLSILSGDDALTLPMVAVGARGVISVTSNYLPAEVSRATRLAVDGETKAARAAHLGLVPVHAAMFVEANPSPVKACLARDGKMSSGVRLPLVPASEAASKTVFAAVDVYRAAAAHAK